MLAGLDSFPELVYLLDNKLNKIKDIRKQLEWKFELKLNAVKSFRDPGSFHAVGKLYISVACCPVSTVTQMLVLSIALFV